MPRSLERTGNVLLVPLAGVTALVLLAVTAFVALRRPSVRIDDAGEWQFGPGEQLAVVTTVLVDNPNPLGTLLGPRLGARYHLDLNGVRIAEGETTGLRLPSGKGTLSLTSSVRADQFSAWWVEYVENDETIDVTAGGELTLDLGLTATKRIPPVAERLFADERPVIDALSSAADGLTGRYTLDPETVVGQFTYGLLDFGGLGPSVGYEIEEGWARWGRVTDERTTVVFHFEVHNPGNAPVPGVPDGIRLTLEANDVTLFTARDGALTLETASTRQLAPGETRTVEYPVTMKNETIDEWFRSHVRNGERSDLEVSLQFVFRPPGFGLAIRVPPGRVPTTTCDIRTAILEDQTPGTDCSDLPGIELVRRKRRRTGRR